MASPLMEASGMWRRMLSTMLRYRACVYPRRMPRSTSSSPLWNGMWKNSHIFGSSAHARISRSVKSAANIVEWSEVQADAFAPEHSNLVMATTTGELRR